MTTNSGPFSVELNNAAAPFIEASKRPKVKEFDRHAGVDDTSTGLYLFPDLVDMSKAGKNEVILPDYLQKALPQVIAGDDTATTVFLAEALKPKDTGKHTSTREMTQTGVWSERNTREASAEIGREDSEAFVARVRSIH